MLWGAQPKPRPPETPAGTWYLGTCLRGSGKAHPSCSDGGCCSKVPMDGGRAGCPGSAQGPVYLHRSPFLAGSCYARHDRRRRSAKSAFSTMTNRLIPSPDGSQPHKGVSPGGRFILLQAFLQNRDVQNHGETRESRRCCLPGVTCLCGLLLTCNFFCISKSSPEKHYLTKLYFGLYFPSCRRV